MPIKIEITGNDAAEIAQQLLTMAFTIAPKLASKQPAPESQSAVEAETVEPAKEPAKRRGRPKKQETIEHEEKSVDSGDDADGDGPEATAEDTVPSADVAGEPPANGEAADPEMTISELRAYTIAYLREAFEGLEKQKDEFGKLLSAFGVDKIGDLPDDKIGAFKALVDEKKAA